MNRHLVVYVKNDDIQEFIAKLDSKGWAVMDIEPTTRINYFSIGIGALGIVLASLITFIDIPLKLVIFLASILGIAFLSTLGISSVINYAVVCEYVGNDEMIDMTPFDDTDDVFEKNENYVPDDKKETEE